MKKKKSNSTAIFTAGKKNFRYLYNDFLPDQDFREWHEPIQRSVVWRYRQGKVANRPLSYDLTDDYSFTRAYWRPMEGPIPTQEGEIMYPLILKFLNFLDVDGILRVRLNMDLARSDHFSSGFHTDLGEAFEYKTAIFYFNDCNGFTQFEKDKAPVKSKANRLIIFDGRLRHQGVLQTDTSVRYVLNVNYVSSKVPRGGLSF